MSFFHHYISIVDLLLFSILTPTPSNISKMVYAFPLMIAQAIQTHPPTLFVCAVVHVDKRWRVAESGCFGFEPVHTAIEIAVGKTKL